MANKILAEQGQPQVELPTNLQDFKEVRVEKEIKIYVQNYCRSCDADSMDWIYHLPFGRAWRVSQGRRDSR